LVQFFHTSYTLPSGNDPDEAAERSAGRIWDEINAPNLRENILPTRERARLILGKDSDHAVETVRLRKV
jgi:type I pantothenate kinase